MSSNASTEEIKPNDTMAESIVKRLPKELSNKVYEFVMDNEFISRDGLRRLQGTTHAPQHAEPEPLTLRQKPAPLQVSSEMRTAAIGYFFQNPVWLMHEKRTPSENQDRKSVV